MALMACLLYLIVLLLGSKILNMTHMLLMLAIFNYAYCVMACLQGKKTGPCSTSDHLILLSSKYVWIKLLNEHICVFWIIRLINRKKFVFFRKNTDLQNLEAVKANECLQTLKTPGGYVS